MKKQLIFSLLMALMFLTGTAFAGNGMMNGSSSPMQKNSNMEMQYMSPQHQMNGGMMTNNKQGCDSAQQLSVMIKMMTNPTMIKMMAQMKGLSKTARGQMLNRHMKMVQELIDANKKVNCSKSQKAGMVNMLTNPEMVKFMSQMEGMTTKGRTMMMRNNASMMMQMMRMGMMGGNSMMMNSKNGMMNGNDNMSSGNMGNMNMSQNTSAKAHMTKKNPIIRKGVINVNAIDKNHDGKLYEDVMDWNVISDKPGTCPICGMKLREFTVQQVKENLKKHGFKCK